MEHFNEEIETIGDESDDIEMEASDEYASYWRTS